MESHDPAIAPVAGRPPVSESPGPAPSSGLPTAVRGIVTQSDAKGTFVLTVGDRMITARGATHLVPGMLVEVRLGQGGFASFVQILDSGARVDEVRAALAAATAGAASRATTVPGRDSALGELAEILRLPQVPPAPALAISMAAFVRGLMHSPDAFGNDDAADVSAGQSTLASHGPEHSVIGRAAEELQGERQRVLAQWMAADRAEFAIPVDLPGPGWLRLRVGRRRSDDQRSAPEAPASISLLVEIPELGATIIDATLAQGGLDTAITTARESTAQLLNEQRGALASALGAAGLRLRAICIEADATRIAREWAAWPVPTVEGGSLIDTRA